MCVQSQGSVVFHLKFSKIDKFLKRAFETCDNEQDNVLRTSNIVKKQKRVERQYREDYIQYGFSWCGNKDAPKPLCVIYGEQLVNEAMVSSKLIRHLNAKHAVHAHKNKNYFKRILAKIRSKSVIGSYLLQSPKKH